MSKDQYTRYGTLAGVGWAILVLVLGVWIALRLAAGDVLNGELTALLPATERDPVSEASASLAQERLERRLLVVVGGEVDPAQAATASREVRDSLLASGLLTAAPSLDIAAGQALAAFYRQAPFGLVSERLRQRLSGDDPAGALEEAIVRRYYLPGSLAGSTLIRQDPLLLVTDFLQSVNRPPAGVEWMLVDGQPVLIQGGEAFVPLQFDLTRSPFSVPYQDSLMPQLQALRQALASRSPAMRLHIAGVLPHAAAGTASAREEVSVIGTASLLAVVGLLILTFRSARPLIFSLVAIGVGTLVGFAATLWLFGSVHLFTVVFAVSLVGTAEDFTFHFFATRFDPGGEWCPDEAMRHVLPSLTLGLLTTLLGFMGLILSGFPGLIQIAIFSMVGLTAAFLTTLWWYPLFTRRAGRAGGVVAKAADRWLAFWDRPATRRAAPVALVLIALASTAAALRLHSNDDVRQFQARDKAVVSDETAARRALGDAGEGVFLLVRGRDAGEVLQREERLRDLLDPLQRSGDIAGYQALSSFVPSPERQTQSIALLQRAAAGPDGALSRITARIGLDPSLLHSYAQALAEAEPFTLQSWLADAASAPYRHLWLGASSKDTSWVASAVLLRGVKNKEFLSEISLPDGVELIDPAADASAMFARYRVRAVWLILGSYLCVALLLCHRYGALGGAQVMAVPCLAALVCLGAFGLLGIGFSLFHAMALLLVLGMGVDYGLFFRESEGGDRGTLVAIATSVISTLLSFGLLGLSATAAISAFGQTVAIGIISSFLASPLARRTAFLRDNHTETLHVQ